MSVELAERFHSLSAEDRRAVEVVATSMLSIACLGAPNGWEARLLRKAMETVADMKPKNPPKEAKP